ncbi:MAG: hypothetical protein NC120_14040 [Ruminococcus sp.]|nr:hypothetical protein [Ruminococcus sp.]
MAMTKKTYYGSGKVYSADYSESAFPKVADVKKITPDEAQNIIDFVTKIMSEDNQIGYLKDGYEVKVETSNLSDKSDLGEMKIDVITDEKGTVNFKLFNANGETIARQYPTAKHSSDAASGFGFTFVGGLDGMDETVHVIVFKHDDKKYGDTVVVAIGKNTSGFDAVWKQDSVTPFACAYALEPFYDSGEFLLICDCKAGHVWTVSGGDGE